MTGSVQAHKATAMVEENAQYVLVYCNVFLKMIQNIYKSSGADSENWKAYDVDIQSISPNSMLEQDQIEVLHKTSRKPCSTLT